MKPTTHRQVVQYSCLHTLLMTSSLNIFGEHSISDLHLGSTGFEYRDGCWETFTGFLAGLLSHSK